MRLFSKIIGGGLTETVKGIAGVFTPNKEAQSQRDAEARAASMVQYAAEFNVHANRNWFDSIVDGLNRLVRPIMAYSVIGFFGVVIYDVDLAMKAIQSLAIVPTGMWALLSIIVTFYFGGRMHLKGKQFLVTKAQLEASKSMAELRKDNADTVSADEYVNSMSDTKKTLPNNVILEWKRRRG